MQDERVPRQELLGIVYQYNSPYHYGSIVTVDSGTYARAAAQGGTIDLKTWSAPYFIAKHLDGHEIVYGSIPYLIGEVAKPIFRLNHRLNVFKDSLPPEIRSSIQETHDNNVIVYTVPGLEFPDWFIHRQEELVKEALLLSGLHLRTLLDILGDKGNRPVPVYNYEGNQNTAVPGNPDGTVTLHKLLNMMMHHRYWVISDQQYVHDIFSDKQELESTALFGSKVKCSELLETVIACLSEFTINKFVGVLRGRLISLTTESAPREIMFATQNVHALGQIIGDRISDQRFGTLQGFLFSELTADERSQIEAATRQDAIELVRHFGRPSFKVAEKLHEKRLTMAITINGKAETFQFDQARFFDALTQAFGDDPIMTLDRLIERYDKPEVEVLA